MRRSLCPSSIRFQPLYLRYKEYLSGKFYAPCNRFSVDNIEIKGYDADRNQFYTIEMPDLEQLGIDDIDEAYKTYFNVENED